jgi:lysophospholipase L1-like esterase
MAHLIHSPGRVAGCILIALLTLEASARVEDWVRYGAPLFKNYTADSLYRFDSNGKSGKPNARYMKWKLNEQGYRGPALRGDAYRIVCVGSSETFGQYEAEGQEWPRQLERILAGGESNPPVEVVNWAYPGLTIATNNRRLRQTLGQLRPRVVVVYPSFTSYISMARITAAPVVTTPTESPEFRLTARVQTLLKNAIPTPIQDSIRDLQVRFTDQNTNAVPRLPQANVDRFDSDLDSLVAGIQEDGATAVLVTHATRFGASITPDEHRYLVAWRKFFPTLREEGFLDMEQRMNQVVSNVARRQSAPLVDAAARLEPGPKNFVEFVHFTDEGARALATLVAERLQPMIERCDNATVGNAKIASAPDQKGKRP